jgi:hypothetical protein
MKKQMVFVGILVMALLVFGIMGCKTDGVGDDGDDGIGDDGRDAKVTKFEGTWKDSVGAEYVFANDTWKILNRPGKTVIPSGTFTFTDEPALIEFTSTGDGGSGHWRYSYEFKSSNTILNFSGSGGPSDSTGDFTKQP